LPVVEQAALGGPYATIAGSVVQGRWAYSIFYTLDRKGERTSPRSCRPAAMPATGNRLTDSGYLAHARRKFFDLFETTKSPLAKT
jgi:hypothetical protein